MKYVPPWREPYFIGVAGCSGSGKTSITQELIKKLNVPWTVLLSMDNFYRPLDWEDRQLAYRSQFDFDHPSCVDFDLLLDVLGKLKRGEITEVPIYSFKQHNRTNQTLPIYGANIVIIEGIYALYDQRILDMFDLKVFVHEDYDVCMARRLHRDILYRGREIELSIKQWHTYVKPNYLAHILPTSKVANLLIPKGMENIVAINMLYTFLQRLLYNKSQMHLEELRNLGRECQADEGIKWYVELEKTNQVRALQTMLYDRNCDMANFIYSVDRLTRRLVTLAMDMLCDIGLGAPVIHSDSDIPYSPPAEVCAATLVRGGECFESTLRQLLPDIYIGRLLILSDTRTGEPKLHLSKLPNGLGNDMPVILTEAQIYSGASAVMAVAILVDHGVPEEHIVVCALVASEIGARRIHAAFPDVKLLFGEIDPKPEQLKIDARYYGTIDRQ